MKEIVVVGIGGALGSMLRYVVGVLLKSNDHDFPWNTFLVNVIGSLMVGFLAEWFLRQQTDHSIFRSFLIVGFCGGFTTFSSFSLETFKLFKNGHAAMALVYILVSFICSLGAVISGYGLSNYFNKN